MTDASMFLGRTDLGSMLGILTDPTLTAGRVTPGDDAESWTVRFSSAGLHQGSRTGREPSRLSQMPDGSALGRTLNPSTWEEAVVRDFSS